MELIFIMLAFFGVIIIGGGAMCFCYSVHSLTKFTFNFIFDRL